MFELLKVKSWELDLDQLIEKQKQVRNMMWLTFIPFTILYLIGMIIWVSTTWVIFPVVCFYLSILLLIAISMIKTGEIALTVIICNKKP